MEQHRSDVRVGVAVAVGVEAGRPGEASEAGEEEGAHAKKMAWRVLRRLGPSEVHFWE